MSGITTTGSTILPMIERARLASCCGGAATMACGIGIVVMALAVLPMSVGGMQLFKTEYESADKVIPRLRNWQAAFSLPIPA